MANLTRVAFVTQAVVGQPVPAYEALPPVAEPPLARVLPFRTSPAPQLPLGWLLFFLPFTLASDGAGDLEEKPLAPLTPNEIKKIDAWQTEESLRLYFGKSWKPQVEKYLGKARISTRKNPASEDDLFNEFQRLKTLFPYLPNALILNMLSCHFNAPTSESKEISASEMGAVSSPIVPIGQADEFYLRFDRAFFFGNYVDERNTLLKILKEGEGIVGGQKDQNAMARSLDVGTVSGFYPHAFSFFGFQAYGFNLDMGALFYARENGIQYHGFHSLPPTEELDDFISRLQKRAAFVQGDMLTLPFLDESFGVITVMSGTFSYVEDHDRALSELARVLGPSGFLIISDWNIASPTQDFAGLYTPDQQELLRRRHLGYPHLLTKLRTNGLEPRAAYLHSGRNMYMVLAIKK